MNRFIHLLVRLARTVEYDLFGFESDAQRFEKLTAAVYFTINTGVEHGLQDCHVRICFRGVTELNRAIDNFGCAPKAIDVVADSTFGKDKERRLELANSLDIIP